MDCNNNNNYMQLFIKFLQLHSIRKIDLQMMMMIKLYFMLKVMRMSAGMIVIRTKYFYLEFEEKKQDWFNLPLTFSPSFLGFPMLQSRENFIFLLLTLWNPTKKLEIYLCRRYIAWGPSQSSCLELQPLSFSVQIQLMNFSYCS